MTPPTEPREIATALERVNVIAHPTVVMRRDALHAVGGYRPAYLRGEDYDLWLRVSERHDLYNLPDRLFLYRRSPDQVSEKHILVQAIGAACARYAAQQRRAGLPDPFEGATSLPSLDQIDAVLCSSGVGARMRLEVIDSIKYSPEAMSGGGLELMQAHLRDGGTKQGFWRTAGRMVKMGMIPQALTLSLDLMRY